MEQTAAVLSFALEICAYVAVGYLAWKWTGGTWLRWLAAVGAVALWVLAWALFGAPGAPIAAHGVGRVLLEVCWFGVPIVGLFALWRRGPALFLLACVVNVVIRLAAGTV